MLDKKILALQVELSELANEWRGFKFWSEDQEPAAIVYTNRYIKDPLLEEYVDCLHFILSIGNELGDMTSYNYYSVDSPLNQNLVDTFTSLITDAEALREPDRENSYVMIFCRILSLGDQLGFTWEEIEQAYYDKNKVNHERQENGY